VCQCPRHESMHGEAEVQLHPFLRSALEGDSILTLRTFRSPTPKAPGTQRSKGSVQPRVGLDVSKNSISRAGIRISGHPARSLGSKPDELPRLPDCCTYRLEQYFSTAGPRPGTGPWHQLHRAARGSAGICHFSFLNNFHE